VTGAVLVEAVRTPVGARHGSLSGWHPADLAGLVLGELGERCDLDPALVEDVVLGCAAQVGAQGFNLGRNAVLAAGFPETVPAATVDRQCASSHTALHVAAHAAASGARGLVVAAGVEVTSLVPVGATFGLGVGSPFGPGVEARFAGAGGLVPQGVSAELVAERWSLDRGQLDAHALEAHERALAARAGGPGAEVVAVDGRRRDGETGQVAATGTEVVLDECVDASLSSAELAGRKPAVAEDGVVTSGNSAPVADGAAAVLVASAATAERLGLAPRARVRATATVGVGARVALTGAIDATRMVLERTGLAVGDLDLVELHEPFSSVGLAWLHELGADPGRVNATGSALSLGHPVGATGARMVATLLAGLEHSDGRLGLVATGASGGLGEATVIERLG
jgi:acetyl-CoA acetyltransferase family protein